jgi:exodeoxyribonuclease III
MLIKIISFNINGLRNKIKDIENNFNNYDIIAIQENKLNENIIKNKLFTDFFEYHFISKELPGNFGVSFLINNKSSFIKIIKIKEIILTNMSGRVCLLNIEINNINLNIINIYAPHISNVEDEIKLNNKYYFFKGLIDVINKYNDNNLILLGDFNSAPNKNIDYLYNSKITPPGFHNEEIYIFNKFVEKTNLNNLYIFSGIYTYYSQRTRIKNIMFKHNKGLTVDSIMINNYLKKNVSNINFDILKKYYGISDHLPLLVKINF